MNISHQQFANDTFLPRKSLDEEALNFKSLKRYVEASGKNVNVDKSKIFFINTKHGVENEICIIMGYRKGSFPCKYLGIHLEQ